MHMIPGRAVRTAALCTLAAIAGLGAPAIPATAQYAITAADPGTSLAGALRILSRDPRNFLALIAAGRASLDMGDTQAAAGFYGRAEEAAPQSPVPKIGMAAALTAMGDARAAMTYFDRATALGAPQSMLALDRGLALDLLGQQPRAQADYRVAMFGTQADEARRRLALSQAISKDFRGAAATLQPLLARRDPGSLRTNAFVLALAGDREGARRMIDSAQPGAGTQFEPFFRLLPGLRADEKAMAVHLGEFPKDAAQRSALAPHLTASPVVSIYNGREAAFTPPRRAPPVQTTPRKNAELKPPAGTSTKIVVAPAPVVTPVAPPSTRLAMALPTPKPLLTPAPTPTQAPTPVATFTAPPAATLTLTPPPSAIAQPKPDLALETPKATPAVAEPRPGFSADELMPIAEDPEPLLPVNVGSVLNREGEPIVAARTEIAPLPVRSQEAAPPPAPKPKVEFARPPAPKPKIELAKLDTKAKAKVKPKPKSEAEKPKEVAKAKPPASPYFVQLASGANANRMTSEYIKIKAKKPGLFAGRSARVTNGKDLFRLVVGPFKSRDDSGAFVNQLSKAGIDGFTYTAPDGMTFEKIATK